MTCLHETPSIQQREAFPCSSFIVSNMPSGKFVFITVGSENNFYSESPADNRLTFGRRMLKPKCITLTNSGLSDVTTTVKAIALRF